MSRKLLALVAAAACALSLTGNAFAANTGWLRVINVKTDNVAAYVQELDKGRAMMKRLGVNVTTRIWRATYAGPNTGMIVVSQEFPSWQAFVDTQSKTSADPQFSAWLAGLDKIRTIVSDSIYREL
jgi:hypothetical protein